MMSPLATLVATLVVPVAGPLGGPEPCWEVPELDHDEAVGR